MTKLLTTLQQIIYPLRKQQERELKRAIRNGEFVFHYQPEVDLKTGKVMGVEALLRWYHPTRGIIPPMEFIPLLEETKLIKKMSAFLFRQSMMDLRALHELGYTNMFMSVNLSVIQLEDPHLIKVIRQNMHKFKIDPKFYECELTETAILENLPAELEMLEQVNNLKIRLSLDDFGTGYATFNYLRQLSVQKLKIDREFTWSIPDGKNNEIILDAMIRLGKDLGLSVLAEGIETKEQLMWLKKHHCDLGQGFYFSKPIPFNDLVKWLEHNKKQPTVKTSSNMAIKKTADKKRVKSAQKTVRKLKTTQKKK